MLDNKRKFTIRVSHDEYKTIMASITNSGMSINEFVKRACLGQKIEPMPKEQKILLQSLNKLFCNMGNNVNQMARVANKQKNVEVVAADLREVKKGLEEIWQYLKSARRENH